MALLGSEAGSKPDVIEQALLVLEAEQQRAHFPALFGITKAAQYAVSGANALDLDHGGAVAGMVRLIDKLGYHSILAGRTQFAHPSFGLRAVIS